MDIWGLTPRQLQVMRFAARGWDRKDIGAELGISPKTVDIFITQIYTRLNISKGVQSVMLTRMALQKGWILLDEIGPRKHA